MTDGLELAKGDVPVGARVTVRPAQSREGCQHRLHGVPTAELALHEGAELVQRHLHAAEAI